MFPGGERMSVSNIRAFLEITDDRNLSLSHDAVRAVPRSPNKTDAERLEWCRDDALGRRIQQWAIDNPNAPSSWAAAWWRITTY